MNTLDARECFRRSAHVLDHGSNSSVPRPSKLRRQRVAEWARGRHDLAIRRRGHPPGYTLGRCNRREGACRSAVEGQDVYVKV